MGYNNREAEILWEVCDKLIYHGRYFNPKRDAVVIRKSVDYILETIKKPRVIKVERE